MMDMGKFLSKLDERENRLIRRISSVLYILTLYALMGIQLYRQFVLDQPTEAWNDIAIIITFNVVAWIGAVMYLSGVINPKFVKIRVLIIGFLSFVLVGEAFTIFKYTVLMDETLSGKLILDTSLTVLLVSALLIGFWGVLAYLGNQRMEKRIQ